MKKKGFTLVELMGVITVLGLITLLVIPTIINQIRSSKNKIDNVTEKLIYAATDLYLDNKENDYPKYNGAVYCLTLKDLVEDGKLSSPILNSNGDKISLDKVIAVDVTNNSYNYRMPSGCENNIIKTLGDLATISTSLGINRIASCVKAGTECVSGESFAIKVNENDIYKFHVLKDDRDTVTLIMDRNLGNQVAWYASASDNSHGPITALTYLNSQTGDWTNIPLLENYRYIDGGEKYQKVEIKTGETIITAKDSSTIKLVGEARARMLSYEETKDIVTANNGTMPMWLYANLSSSNTMEYPYGYWLLTADTDDSRFDTALYNDYDGHSGDDYTSRDILLFGVRPVIELYK